MISLGTIFAFAPVLYISSPPERSVCISCPGPGCLADTSLSGLVGCSCMVAWGASGVTAPSSEWPGRSLAAGALVRVAVFPRVSESVSLRFCHSAIR